MPVYLASVQVTVSCQRNGTALSCEII